MKRIPTPALKEVLFRLWETAFSLEEIRTAAARRARRAAEAKLEDVRGELAYRGIDL